MKPNSKKINGVDRLEMLGLDWMLEIGQFINRVH
jgi:hypothetical protein